MNRKTHATAGAISALWLLATCWPAAAAGPGAAIFVAGELGGNLEVFSGDGGLVDGGQIGYNVSDGFAVGDVDGDGIDEVVVAGDYSHEVEIREVGNVEAPPIRWNGDFYLGNGLAVGDVLPGGGEEIVIAGQFSNNADIFDAAGNHLAQIDVDFTPLDELALGDVDGDGMDEILIAGDGSGYVDVFRGDGTQIAHLDLGFTVDDGFAAGNVDGVGADEIIIAGNSGGDIDIFNLSGTHIRTFSGGFTTGDGFAVGDINGDGRDDILVAGDYTERVDAYDGYGVLWFSFDCHYTALDGFAVGRHAWPDRDADGLLDNWETGGFDGDGDGVVDVDLAAAGCSPDHKDILVELDWVNGQQPLRRRIQAIKAAFAQAPVDAGGTRNPDGLPGINLIIDTGSLSDPSALEGNGIPANSCQDFTDNDNDGDVDDADSTCSEGAAGPGSCRDGMDNDGDGVTDDKDGDCREGLATCSDGVDNNGDGLVDGNDPLCLVGDNLGGGNGFAASSGPDPLGSTFYATKSSNFSAVRRRIFRYGICGDPAGQTTGGRGEIGGNDFIEYNHDAGTIMHELGHTLGLRHGGADDDNCKPNFVSVMNYDHQGGIPQADGSFVLDYSPPLRADGTRGSALPTLEEDDLDDMVLDYYDDTNMFIHTDHSDNKITSRLNRSVDWGGDGSTTDTDSTVNIDDEGADGNPEACGNILITSTLHGHDDWAAIQFSFRGNTDYDDAPFNPVMGDEPTLAEIQAHDRIISRTNLDVVLSASPNPAVAGETLQYTTTVRNLGPNPTTTSQVRIVLPAGLTHVSTPGCLAAGETITCDLPMFFPDDIHVFTTTAAIDPALVHLAGAPVTVTATATVKNHAGDDPVAANDSATQSTLVKAVADLSMVGVTTAGVPLEMLVGDTTTLSVSELLTSAGPSSPMDARLSRSIVAPPDTTATLGSASDLVTALSSGEARTMTTAVQVTCSQPGVHVFSITSSVAPERPDDTDPVAANDAASTTFAIECVVPVHVRVLPTLTEGRKGVLPVEVSSTEAGEYGLPLAFDATLIDADSVRLASRFVAWNALGGASESHGRTHGGADRVLHFAADATGLGPADGEGCVKGTFTEEDGDVHKFFGCDAVRWSGR